MRRQVTPPRQWKSSLRRLCAEALVWPQARPRLRLTSALVLAHELNCRPQLLWLVVVLLRLLPFLVEVRRVLRAAVLVFYRPSPPLCAPCVLVPILLAPVLPLLSAWAQPPAQLALVLPHLQLALRVRRLPLLLLLRRLRRPRLRLSHCSVRTPLFRPATWTFWTT